MVTTTKGCIDADMVEQFKNLHDKTQQEQNGDQPEQEIKVNSISSNQSQEYFAIATEVGFEIL